MLSSKVFTSGNSQAIRLPKEYQVEDTEMFIQKIGNTIILFPKKNSIPANPRILGRNAFVITNDTVYPNLKSFITLCALSTAKGMIVFMNVISHSVILV